MVIKFYNQFEELDGCRVIEGHLIIAIIQEDCGTIEECDQNLDPERCKDNYKSCFRYENSTKEGNLTFPDLREVTDFVVLYNTKHIKTLSTLFPSLTVIRGNQRIKVI